MTNEPLSLSELSTLSGIEIRTLRSWIAQGVIPGPDSAGRNARYAPSTLLRARAVKAMREVLGLPLSSIRQDLLAADDAQIATYANLSVSSDSQEFRQQEILAPQSTPPVEPPAGSTAASYLRSLRNAGVFGRETLRPRRPSSEGPMMKVPMPMISAEMAATSMPRLAQSGSRLSRLADSLEQIAGSRPTRRKAKGDVRIHIEITPDVELTVRGDLSLEEIGRFEQIADLLRVILTGGSDHD